MTLLAITGIVRRVLLNKHTYELVHLKTFGE
jgi:hypothetical protein